ncbi:hypothetical protein AXF42_Ash004499 [Apostasia shenzhenica]|uniref:Uncharacterized protein n=1 Tax=Apostasia shenzhenica TaxID=1088818 RepID=A0A2I0BGT3_9ASPA|nr:hypothetical protein AXF42_Ash004499 [Apostasia shenzhenica]
MAWFFETVGSFFGGGDNIPWCDGDIIAVRIYRLSSRNLIGVFLHIFLFIWRLLMEIFLDFGHSPIDLDYESSSDTVGDWELLVSDGNDDNLMDLVSYDSCEKEVAEAGAAENRNDCLMRLSWALVHSKKSDDVLRGIAMLEG